MYTIGDFSESLSGSLSWAEEEYPALLNECIGRDPYRLDTEKLALICCNRIWKYKITLH